MNSGRKEQGEVNIRFCGIGGMGVILSCIILGKAALYDNKNAIQTQSYGPEQRGTRVKSDIIIAEGELTSYPTESEVDILVAYSDDAYNFYSNQVKSSGLRFINSDLIKLENITDMTFPIPANSIAQEFKNLKLVNIIMLGALIKKTKLVSLNAIKKSISESIPLRFIEINLKALNAGYEFLKEN
ncbi:MAG: 2-oxoacid:acceptor oxidoreductase family protein [Promethearchaeota archaeon]